MTKCLVLLSVVFYSFLAFGLKESVDATFAKKSEIVTPIKHLALLHGKIMKDIEILKNLSEEDECLNFTLSYYLKKYKESNDQNVISLLPDAQFIIGHLED